MDRGSAIAKKKLARIAALPRNPQNGTKWHPLPEQSSDFAIKVATGMPGTVGAGPDMNERLTQSGKGVSANPSGCIAARCPKKKAARGGPS
ncbi:hypothetical protein KL86PLE_90022 [uncultured Pleomorphomonas sp.]|uniref:Uncharacterized protein n=1 Tax=uncultured Pleomorphomonas sp. TaxID=442121 RepID=A0A212LMA4_9HYPH|nr:hypothetical protein KL86PLE_90022 [uncultured Pleomorphomonas sp.]